MTKLNQVYKCSICGNIVEVLHTGAGKLVCCGKDMDVLNENSVDAAKEKHVPVISQNGNDVTVKVGSVAHPMEEKHFIEWIEVLTADKVYRKYLKSSEAPEAVFTINSDAIESRAYCNLHGLWKS